jgi:hypothetical protein
MISKSFSDNFNIYKELYNIICPKFPLDEITFEYLDIFIKNYKKKIPQDLLIELNKISSIISGCPDIHISSIFSCFFDCIKNKLILNEKFKDYPEEAIFIIINLLMFENINVATIKFSYDDPMDMCFNEFNNGSSNIDAALEILLEQKDIYIESTRDEDDLQTIFSEDGVTLLEKPLEDREKIIYLNCFT